MSATTYPQPMLTVSWDAFAAQRTAIETLCTSWVLHFDSNRVTVVAPSGNLAIIAGLLAPADIVVMRGTDA